MFYFNSNNAHCNNCWMKHCAELISPSPFSIHVWASHPPAVQDVTFVVNLCDSISSAAKKTVQCLYGYSGVETADWPAHKHISVLGDDCSEFEISRKSPAQCWNLRRSNARRLPSRNDTRRLIEYRCSSYRYNHQLRGSIHILASVIALARSSDLMQPNMSLKAALKGWKRIAYTIGLRVLFRKNMVKHISYGTFTNPWYCWGSSPIQRVKIIWGTKHTLKSTTMNIMFFNTFMFLRHWPDSFLAWSNWDETVMSLIWKRKMTSSHGIVFRITDPFWGIEQSLKDTQRQYWGTLMLLLMLARTNWWAHSRVAVDLRHHEFYVTHCNGMSQLRTWENLPSLFEYWIRGMGVQNTVAAFKSDRRLFGADVVCLPYLVDSGYQEKCLLYFNL